MMDKTETFIKMCEKAEKMQESVVLLDFIPSHSNEICYSGNSVYWDGENKVIWLPRQDQLQEMVTGGCVYTLLGDLDSFIQLGHYDEKGLFTSMEQLWLAFVMKERYGKVWDGEDWNEESR